MRRTFLLMSLGYLLSGCHHVAETCRITACDWVHTAKYLSQAEKTRVCEVIGDYAGDRIVTVYVEPVRHWPDGLTIVDRRLVNGVVSSICYGIGPGGEITTEEVYSVRNEQALLMFRNLQKQIAMGFEFVSRSMKRGTPAVGALYAITTGGDAGLTLDAGGLDASDTVASEVNRWETEESLGEKPEDAALAESYFSENAYASPATAIIQALAYFDYLCELTDRARHNEGDGVQRTQPTARRQSPR